MNIDVEIDSSLLINITEKKYALKESKQSKQLDTGIEKQIFVVNIERVIWKKLFDYYSDFKSNLKLSSTQLDILRKASIGGLPMPSEKQSKILHEVYLNAYNEGLDIPRQ